MKWIIRDDETGEILAEFDGTKQEARDMFRSLADKMPDDGHTWSLYERVGL